MEVLSTLEKKISTIVEMVQTLKLENAKLVEEKAFLMEENAELEKKIETLQATQIEIDRLKDVDKETSLTKKVLNELIESIDSLVEKEHQP